MLILRNPTLSRSASFPGCVQAKFAGPSIGCENRSFSYSKQDPRPENKQTERFHCVVVVSYYRDRPFNGLSPNEQLLLLHH